MTCKEALFRKMMDELKDAGMWIDWAFDLREKESNTAKYLITAANERLSKGYPETKKMLCDMIGVDATAAMFMDYTDEWHREMVEKVKNF